MKIVLDLSKVIPFLQRNKRTAGLLSLYLAGLMVMVGLALFWSAYKPMIRDFMLANIAHYRAGPVIPFEDDVYLRGFKIDANDIYAYGIESNNTWMADQLRLITPYFFYEKVSPQGLYPKAVASVPMYNGESFHVAGRMIPDPEGYIALLNERLFIGNRWNDQRRALEVLVHELVHVQGGNYLYGGSEKLEAATSVATVEVLAALCNYDHEYACEAFWLEIESLSRASLEVALTDMGLGHLYQAWANKFWRDDAQEGAFDKAMRRWNEDPGALMVIRTKYQLVPWKEILEKYPVGGEADTGFIIWSMEDLTGLVLGMPFDDIAYLFEEFSWFMEDK